MTGPMMTPGYDMQALSARSFFEQLRGLGPLRIISVSGPSTFEAIGSLGAFGIADGYLNAMTEQYHWHLDVRRFRHLTSHDAVHERSGRRVLFFELREEAAAEPFLRIYLHRAKESEFEPERQARFAALHGSLSAGVELNATPSDPKGLPA
jgi:putative heme iron utilization protein